jgi:hypothetical protein
MERSIPVIALGMACGPFTSLRAKRSNPRLHIGIDGLLRSARNDGWIQPRILATLIARGLHLRFPSGNRGRREDRVRAAPAVSCAGAHKERAHEHTGSAGASRPSLRNGFTAYNALSPANGFLATVAPEKFPRNLMPAPRHQDHTPSPYTIATYVSHGSRVHRISPHVRDDRDPPLSSGETGGVMPVIWVRTKAEYFFAKGWTGFG